MANSFQIFSLVKKNSSQKVFDDNCSLFLLIFILLLDTSNLSFCLAAGKFAILCGEEQDPPPGKFRGQSGQLLHHIHLWPSK
jgi:hypothetical protein